MRSKKINKILKDNVVCLRLTDREFKYINDISIYYNCSIQQMIRIIIEDQILKDEAKGIDYEHQKRNINNRLSV